MPESVLVRQTIGGLPPAPAFAAVARFVYQPGAVFGPAAGTGPVCMYIEAGGMTFTGQGPLLLTSGAAEPRWMPSGIGFQVVAGDQLVVPGNVTHSASTIGTDPASMVGVAMFPSAPPLQFPPGISFEALALGQFDSLPGEPVLVELDRHELPDGATRPISRPAGFTLLHLESGSLGIDADLPGAAVVRAAAAGPPGPPGPPEPIPAGGHVVLAAGDAASVPAGVGLAVRAIGPTSYLQASAAPDAASRRALVNQYYYDAWDGRNPALVDQLFAPGFLNHHLLNGQAGGRAGVRQLLETLHKAFPDGSLSVDLQLAQADQVVTRHTFRGTHQGRFMGVPATGRQVRITGIDLHTVEAGAIQQAWGYLDLAGLARQLGVLS